MSLKKGGLYNPDLIDTDRETIIELYNALDTWKQLPKSLRQHIMNALKKWK
jgi:hypothetical protein